MLCRSKLFFADFYNIHTYIKFVDSKALTVMDELPLGIFGRPNATSNRPQDTTPRKQTRRHSDGDDNSKEIDDIVADNAFETAEAVAASRVDALVNALQISSQLARNSEKHYGLLISVFTAQKLYWILVGTNHTAAAKCCNLIGNLCR